MAFLDWINRKPATQQQNVAKTSQERNQETPAPRNAKEMYAQQAAQDKLAQNRITPAIKEQADRATALLDKASHHLQPQNAPAADGGGSNVAQLQKQEAQDKTQQALSPTDAFAGKTALEEKTTTRQPPKTPPRPTVPRRPPSWER